MDKLLTDKLSKTLFHGTLMDRAENILSNGIDFEKFNSRADFGKGFYLTDSYALAKNTAITRFNEEQQTNGTACSPVIMRIKIKSYDSSLYNIKEFYGESNSWKKFVCCNRWYDKVIKHNPNADHNIDLKYDIIIGLTADGKMGRLGKLLRQDEYNLSDGFIKYLTPFKTKYTKVFNGEIHVYETKAYQISIHNKSLIDGYIRYNGYDVIRLEKEDGYYE